MRRWHRPGRCCAIHGVRGFEVLLAGRPAGRGGWSRFGYRFRQLDAASDAVARRGPNCGSALGTTISRSIHLSASFSVSWQM